MAKSKKIDQGREPPAYQEYPADTIVRMQIAGLSLEEVGFLYVTKCLLWLARDLPACPAELAARLRVSEADVERILPKLSSFLVVQDGRVTCPELEAYRQRLDDRRQKQSAAGRETAKRNRESANGSLGAGFDGGAKQGAKQGAPKQSTTQQSTTQQNPSLPRRDISPYADEPNSGEDVEAFPPHQYSDHEPGDRGGNDSRDGVEAYRRASRGEL